MFSVISEGALTKLPFQVETPAQGPRSPVKFWSDRKTERCMSKDKLVLAVFLSCYVSAQKLKYMPAVDGNQDTGVAGKLYTATAWRK